MVKQRVVFETTEIILSLLLIAIAISKYFFCADLKMIYSNTLLTLRLRKEFSLSFIKMDA